MSRDLRQLLRDTAVEPRQVPDPAALVASGRRRRRRRHAAGAVVGVAAAVLVGVGVFQVLPTGSDPQILDEPPTDPAPAEPAPAEPLPEESPTEDASAEPGPTVAAEPATFVTLPPGREAALLVADGGGLVIVHGWRQAQQATPFEDMDVAISRCLDVACDDVTTTVVASGAALQSLAADVGTDGAPVIGFTDWANESGALLICEGVACATPVRRTVDVGSGMVLDVAVSPEGHPVLAYLRLRPGEVYRLGLLVCGDAACGTFADVVIDEFGGNLGTPAQLGFDRDGAPFLVYWAGKWVGDGTTEQESGVWVTTCADVTCAGGGSAALVIEDVHLVAADPTSEAPTVLVRVDDHLEIVRCQDVACATPVPTRLEAGVLEADGHSPGALLHGPGGAPVVLLAAGDEEGLFWRPRLQVLACQDPACSATTASAITHDSGVFSVAGTVLPGGELLVVTGRTTEEGAPSAPMLLAACPGADCSRMSIPEGGGGS